jgi:hypothetical protein
MSHHNRVRNWAAIIVASALGFFGWWAVQSNGFSENGARATAYTIGIFFLLALALRPAWRRLRLWTDLLILIVLHSVLLLTLVRFLDTHSFRLNWAIALPIVMVELLIALGILWRRNVT